MNINKISIIVPAYKAESIIVDTVKSVEKVLKSVKVRYEIVCVVDGVVDDTLKNISKYSQNKKNIKILKYRKNKGKGYAIRYGARKAAGDIIGFIDAGNEIDPNSLKNLLSVYQKKRADIVVGSKRHPESKVNYPFYRKIISYVYFLLVKSLFDIKVRDTQAGIKIFNKKVIEKLLPNMKIDGFAFDIEMLTLAKKMGFGKIYEAPISVNMPKKNENYSTMKGVAFIMSTSRMFLDTILVFIKITNKKYLLK